MISFILLYLVGQRSPQISLAQSSLEPVVLESNEKSISLTWTPPAYSLAVFEVSGEPYTQIDLSNTGQAARPGYPELPIFSGLIGLPAQGGAQLRIIEVEQELVQLSYPPLPAPVPQPVPSGLSSSQTPPMAGPTIRQPDPTVYATDQFYPATIAELGPVEQMRQQRVARLVINPVRVNPVSRQMEVIRYLHLEISFDQPASTIAGNLNSRGQPSPFAQALAATLINPRASRWPVSSPPAGGIDTAAISPSTENELVKVTVNQTGLHAITYNNLVGAGFSIGSMDPHFLRLTHGWPRQEVAILVEGENDGVFNPGDRILFYAEPEFSRFVDIDVYFLSVGQTNGLRMATRTADPTGLPAGTTWRTAVAETNQFYDSHYPGRDGDYWYWDDLRQPDKTSAAFSVQIDAPLTTGPDAALTLWLQGYTDPVQNPDHRVAVSINGASVGERTWNGGQAIAADFVVPAAALKSGTNQVSLTLPGLSGVVVEGTWLDAIALTYPANQGGAAQITFQGEAGPKAYTLIDWPNANLQVYDITNSTNPRRLTDYNLIPTGPTYTLSLGDADAPAARYLVVPDDQLAVPVSVEPVTVIGDPPGGADYVIITPPDFAGAIAPLAAHRTAQGLRVTTVDVQAIYDTYGGGRMDPTAIKTFLQHAYSSWTAPAPTYVLLVGDGSYDFKDYSGYHSQTFMPPFMAYVDPWWGETAADNQYVTLVGNDALPEMLIGRLPVNTPAETATIVEKIIQYETNPVPGDWNARQIFVADNPDAAGDFHLDSDLGYANVTEPFVGQRLYFNNNDANQPYIYTDAETLRAFFLNSFNQGASLITFHGHSSWLQWAVEGLFRYHWSSDPASNDVVTLHNQYRLPVVLEMTCFTGSFHRPEYGTLDESLLRLPGGGAVAVWGSTGLGVSTGHISLQTGFYQAINNYGVRDLGTAIMAGKIELYGTGFHQELLDTFTLFGDPALNLNLSVTSFSNHVYLPLIQR